MLLKCFWGTIFFVLLGMTLVNAQAAELRTELHWNVCEDSSALILKKLGLEVHKKSQRSISYFDRWSERLGDFEYYSDGVVLRQRVSEEDEKTSSVKVRFSNPQVEESFPWENIKCESDLARDNLNHFCALSSKDFLSSDQSEFLNEFAVPVDMSALKEFGPTANTVWKLKRAHEEDIVLEELVLPSKNIFELSMRYQGLNAQAEYETLALWFESKNIRLCTSQVGKTRQVLEAYR